MTQLRNKVLAFSLVLPFSIPLWAQHPGASLGTMRADKAEQIIGTVIPHSDFGDAECCRCLNIFLLDDQVEFRCNECGKVVRNLAKTKLSAVLKEMQSGMEIVQGWCGTVHVSPGFSELYAFICDNCGAYMDVRPQ